MISHNELGAYVHEFEPHKFTADASDLYDAVPEMREGFPRAIETSLGNGQPFMLAHIERDEGDILYARYDQSLGCISLRVFND